MNKETYLLLRQQWDQKHQPRAFCWQCRKPKIVCYCKLLEPFNSRIEFVILVHPDEARRHIASARMAHLNIIGSQFIVGEDFSDHPVITQLLSDHARSCWTLYPGHSAVPLHEADCAEVFWQSVGTSKRATVFVIDGTWRKVGRMIASNPNLLELPRLSFHPPHPSQFKIRRQPAAYCWSTLEAIDFVIAQTNAAPPDKRAVLQRCFQYMVSQQIGFERNSSTRNV